MSTPVIVAFITGVLGPILVLYIKSVLDKKKPNDMVRDTLRVSELVTTKIEQIKIQAVAPLIEISSLIDINVDSLSVL